MGLECSIKHNQVSSMNTSFTININVDLPKVIHLIKGPD